MKGDQIKGLLIFTLALAFNSCENKPIRKYSDIKTLGAVYPSFFLDSILSNYTHEVKSEYGYAIYIDKKNEMENYMITIAPFLEKVGLYESGAVNYFILNNSVPVYIYTGIEDFVRSDSPAFHYAHETIQEASPSGEFKNITNALIKIDFSRAVSFVHVDDTSYTVKGETVTFSTLTLLPAIFFRQPDSMTK